MSKRKPDANDDYSGGIYGELSKVAKTSQRQHTMESDDEENEEGYNKKKYDVMNPDDIEGQEEGTVEFDGEVKITPFNMKDEMEDGYFDGNGMYIWNKRDPNEVKDGWLDSIDWNKVKSEKGEPVASSSKSLASKDNPIIYYKELTKYLQPTENILTAIKRLGGNQLSASERLKQKKLNPELFKDHIAKSLADITSATAVTELANKILNRTGNMNVYQETLEAILHKIAKHDAKEREDDGEDMFGDEFNASNVNTAGTSDPNDVDMEDASMEELWEFKWENTEEAAIHGPHKSSEMLAWKTEGYFSKEVYVRKYNQGGAFYSSGRIDFDLYC